MKSKFLTKRQLIAVNEQARGNHIDPGFSGTIPATFKYPVCRALPFPLERGWLRCWVTVGADNPVVEENIRHLLVDMPGEVFEALPTVEHDDTVEHDVAIIRQDAPAFTLGDGVHRPLGLSIDCSRASQR